MSMRMSKIEYLLDKQDAVSLPLISVIDIKFKELIYIKFEF